jgi:hypothetical protein
MLNSALRYLLSMPKMKIKIKDKINDDKITFYIFKALNAHIPKQKFYINKICLTNALGYCLTFFF